jgi:hypothetical protein
MEEMKQTMTTKVITEELQHTSMRCQLVCTLKDLSDLAYQEKYWCRKTAHQNFFWGNLRMVIEFLEDIGLMNYEEPEETIGYTTRSAEELHIVLSAVKFLEQILKEIGWNYPDDVYLNSPLWQPLVEASAKAFAYIKNQGLDEKYVGWAEAPRPEPTHKLSTTSDDGAQATKVQVGIPANYRKNLFIDKEDVKDTPRKYSSELLWILLLVLIFLAVIVTMLPPKHP